MTSSPVRPVASRLALHRPTLEELEVRRRWLCDPQMMSYNAGWNLPHPGYDNATGCINWPRAEWDGFLAEYANPSRAGYFYLLDLASHGFVGHVHYRLPADDHAEIGVNIIPSRRHQGLGHEALHLLLVRIWATTTAIVVTNEFEDNRIGAPRLHAAVGFQPGDVFAYADRQIRRWWIERPTP